MNSDYCEKCTLGKEPTAQLDGCADCPVDTYGYSNTGHGICVACADNSGTNSMTGVSTSEGGVDACSCDAGYIVDMTSDDGVFRCMACPKGRYGALCEGGCATGETSSEGSVDMSSCSKCDKGLFSFDEMVSTGSSELIKRDCHSCPSSKTTDGEGTYWEGGQAGVDPPIDLCKCEPGTMREGESTCLDCTENTYSSTNNAEYCSSCPEGSDTDGATKSASVESCNCGQGKEVQASSDPTLGAISYACQNCGYGTYSSSSMSKCEDCGQGKFAEVEGGEL